MRTIVKCARARLTDYSITINGLLTKRPEHFNEAISLRDRLAEIKNDVDAIDRTLGSLGYLGDIDAVMPRKQRNVIFKRRELMRFILLELRYAGKSLTSREIAGHIMEAPGEDPNDRKRIDDITMRVRKTLKRLKDQGAVQSTLGKGGCLYWSLQNQNLPVANIPSTHG